MEFVKAKQPQLLGDLVGDRLQRIFGARMHAHLGVNFAHEFVEVDAPFAFQGGDTIESIHHQRLAATDTAPDVQATWRTLAAAKIGHQSIDRTLPILAILFQVAVQALKMLQYSELRRIRFEIGLLRKLPVPLERARCLDCIRMFDFPGDIGKWRRLGHRLLRADKINKLQH